MTGGGGWLIEEVGVKRLALLDQASEVKLLG